MNAPLKYLLDLGKRRQKHKEDRKMEKKNKGLEGGEGGDLLWPRRSRISGNATNRMRSDCESCTFPARSRGLRLQ